MTNSREKYYRGLFFICAGYDLFLGIIFIFFGRQAFTVLGIGNKMPLFGGYLSLIGAFLLVIDIAYWLIFRGNLYQNHDLILIGALYKLAYSLVSFIYFIMGNIPHLVFFQIFGVADLIMFILIAECLCFIRREKRLRVRI